MEEKKEFDRIPESKVQRAMKIIGTGMKVGGNYASHYAKNVFKEQDKSKLHEKNATVVYDALSEMKGTALKMAQMLSMDEFTLPENYQKIFQAAQHNAPPLSFPLVQKTFRTEFGKEASEMFDEFGKNAIHAASIGQVHLATKNGKKLAVKIQYPGVANSIESDLKLMKPIAQNMMNVKAKDIEFYMDEVKNTLLDETDYEKELENGRWMKEKCAPISNLFIPNYYPELSNKRILTMDWVEGLTLSEWLPTKPTVENRTKVAQTIWDTFLFQIQELNRVHADPHPGNFLVNEQNEVCLLDFGCVKEIPEAFYQNFFTLLLPEVLGNNDRLMQLMQELQFFTEEDSPEDKAYLFESLSYSMKLIAIPFQTKTFDFSSPEFLGNIYSQGEDLAKEVRKRKMNGARGPKEGIYLLRTFYGLYMILAKLGGELQLNYNLVDKLKS